MSGEASLASATEIRWVVSHSANCFHAADAIRRGRRPADAVLAEVLHEPVRLLRQTVQSLGLDEAAFWNHLVPLSASIENNTQLVEAVLRKAIGVNGQTSSLVGPLAGRVADVEAAVRRTMPELIGQLSAQTELFAARWQEPLAALLDAIGRQTDPRLIVPRADVVLLPTVTGGDGAAYLPYNMVQIEAVEPDPEPRLPEVVRLAWLLAQLPVDLPMFSEMIPRDRVPLVAALAMLPVALAAAAELRLTDSYGPLLSLALDRWHVAKAADADLADVLATWWTSHLDMRPAWNVSLGALDRMIGGAR